MTLLGGVTHTELYPHGIINGFPTVLACVIGDGIINRTPTVLACVIGDGIINRVPTVLAHLLWTE